MEEVTQFLEYWGLAFGTLCAALVLLELYYRLLKINLELHGFRQEVVIAGAASLLQVAGYWLSGVLFGGHPFRRAVIPSIIIGIVYFFTHRRRWTGYEMVGIAVFQSVVVSTGHYLLLQEFKLAAIIFALFLVSLVVIGSIVKGW